MHFSPGAGDPHVDPVARWLAACRCVGGELRVRLDLRGKRPDMGEPRVRDDLDLTRDEQQTLLALWERRDRMTHFERLGVPPTADLAAIRRAYHDTCRRLHPDRYYGKRLGTYAAILAELFDRARVAHDTLVDPRRRAQYLARLADAGPRRGAGDAVGAAR